MKYFFLSIFSLGIIVLSSQDNINSSTFNQIQAQWYGPATTSGRITAIEGVNSEPKRIVVGTAGGGVWISKNGGATFENKFEKYCQSIGALAIDQTNPKTIYVGTGESNMRNTVSYGDGLYKSEDGGSNWKKIGLDSTMHISKIIIDPKNTQTIYVSAPGTLWANSSHRGLYKSIDGGATWKKILYINEMTGCADIVMNPNNPNELLASMWQFRRQPFSFSSGGPSSALFKSVDGGATWKKITEGLPAGDLGRIALALSPSKPSHILAIVEAKETGLYESHDGGNTWGKRAATLNVEARPFYFSTIAFDPKDDQRVYRPAFQLSISDDAGKSFTDASGEGVWLHSDHHAIWINPNYTNQIWLGTDGGVFLSNDRGITWHFMQNLPVGQLYHAQFDMKEPYNMYVGLQDNGSHMVPSQDYGGISNSSWRALYGGDGFWVQADPDGKSVYAEYQGGNLSRINLKTGTSDKIQPTQSEGEDKFRYNWNTPVVLGAANSKNLYTACQYLFKSTNQGRDWERISPDLTTNDKKKQQQEQSGGLSADNTSAENHCTIYTIAESPLDENYILVGTDDGNIQLTTNAGSSWTNLAKNYSASGIPTGTWISSIEFSRHDKNTIYATFDNHNYGDFGTYAAVSRDLGKTWTRFMSKEFAGFASKIKEDLVNKNLIFLGTERGLMISTNAGKSWFKFKNNMNEMAMVRDIQIHPRDHDVIIATHGNGLIVLRDITTMRVMDSSIASQDFYLFPIKSSQHSLGNFESGFPSNDGWRIGNKSESVEIKYYQKKRNSTGEILAEIQDQNGKLVKKLTTNNKRGINTIMWDMTETPPRTASGSTKTDFGGFMAPLVPTGNYKVVFNVNGKVYSQSIEVKANPVFNMSAEDLQKQYEAAQTCKKMHEELAVLADSVNVKQLYYHSTSDSIMLNKIAEFKNRLMATKTTSIFADEKRIRERITEIYASVSFQQSRPSNLQINNLRLLRTELDAAKRDWEALEKKMKP